MKRLTHLLGLCVLLAACGGGGGGNGGGDNNGGGGGGGGGSATCTPESGKLQITNDNAAKVSAQAYEATTNIPDITEAEYYVLSLLFLLNQSTNGMFSCPTGGSYTQEMNDTLIMAIFPQAM